MKKELDPFVDETFDEKTITRYVKSKIFGKTIEFLPQTDSTQLVALHGAVSGKKEGFAVVADEQFAGRGRHEHRWESPKGLNLYLSVLFRPKFLTLMRSNEIQFLSAVAAAQTLRALFQLEAELKWPNDIWVKNRKLGGVILSTTAPNPDEVQYIVMGMGINLNGGESDFSPAVRQLATSVFLEKGRRVNRPLFLGELLFRMETLYEELRRAGFDGIRKEWQRLAPRMCQGKINIANVMATPGSKKFDQLVARPKGINSQCQLVVEDPSGQLLSVLDGEITFSA